MQGNPRSSDTPPNESSDEKHPRRRSSYGVGYGYPRSGGYGGYGYGYSNYGSNYGYAGYGGDEEDGLASLRRYLQILRERKWYALTAFFAIFLGTVLYTFSITKVYEAQASVQIFRKDTAAIKVQEVVESEVRSAEDLNTEVKLLESTTLIEQVANRLTEDQKNELLAPYKVATLSREEVYKRLLKNRTIVPQRLSLVININFDHPSPKLAATIANLFAEEYIASGAHLRVENAVRAGEELRQRSDEQRAKVSQLAIKLQKYREDHDMVSLDQRKDILTERLKAISVHLTQIQSQAEEARIRWEQIKAAKEVGADLTAIPNIGNDLSVRKLKEDLANLKITEAQLLQRYLPGHPKVREIDQQIAQATSQLNLMVDGVVKTIENDYLTWKQNVEQAQADLKTEEARSLELDRAAVAYGEVEREYKIAEQMLQNLISRMAELTMTSAMQSLNARILDLAKAPKIPILPNVPLFLALGTAGGAFIGIILAFVVARFDDRMQSPLDVEHVLGLPLIGVIPHSKLEDPQALAKAAITGADSVIEESLRGLQALLNLKEDIQKYKTILITSTIPSEGKSFLSVNLAYLFAGKGERVCLLDCDLRKPSQHRLLGTENVRGMIELIEKGPALYDEIKVQITPNLDFVASGGRSSKSTRLLMDKNFNLLLLELKKKYDHIIIDTPPVGVLSDALVTLQLVDSWLYVVEFNRAKKQMVSACVAKMHDSKVPSLGVVMNGVKIGTTGYSYYGNYYYGSYHQYKDYHAES